MTLTSCGTQNQGCCGSVASSYVVATDTAYNSFKRFMFMRVMLYRSFGKVRLRMQISGTERITRTSNVVVRARIRLCSKSRSLAGSPTINLLLLYCFSAGLALICTGVSVLSFVIGAVMVLIQVQQPPLK